MWANKLKYVVSTLFVSAMLSLGTVGCAPTSRTVGTTLDDAGITGRVKTAIASESGLGEALGINVDTYRGVVSLNGFVDTQEQIDLAMKAAQRVGGVTSIKNNLSIKPKS